MIFYIKISIKMHKHEDAQSTQNSKFVISLQYLRKEGRDEVDTINLGGHGQACPNAVNSKFSKSFQYLKKEVRDEVDFLCNKHHSFL